MNLDMQGSSCQLRQYMALQDYQAFTPGYLSFTTGDLIDVTENGQLIGRLQNGEEGQITSETLKILFPSDLFDNLVMYTQEGTDSTLVFNGQFQRFPRNAFSDFKAIRTTPGMAYFDRTRYISVLESQDSFLLFLRPRRFGKSLTLSMLAHFHGVEHKAEFDELFKGLAVYRDVKNNTVKPHQYLILSLDFSNIDCDHSDPKIANVKLCNMINDAIERFYMTYASYLGDKTDEDLIRRFINPENALSSLTRCVSVVQKAIRKNILTGVKGIYLLADEYDAFGNRFLDLDNPNNYNDGQSSLKAFWASVKSGSGLEKIRKCFITGVLPLSLADLTSGFNIQTNVSDKEKLAGLCGLSKGDVCSALRHICPDDVEKHIVIMERHFNGYCFSPQAATQRVFNTNTCLEYLQCLLENEPINPEAPSNMETSETLLRLLASSPVAVGILEDISPPDSTSNPNAWQNPIAYDKLPSQFRFSDLKDGMKNKDSIKNKEAWLSFMRYAGGLTYGEREKQLRIPNFVQLQRFIRVILRHYDLDLDDVRGALREITTYGDPSKLLGCYQRLMTRRDVHEYDFKMNEADHRDSVYTTLLMTPGIQTHIEFKVTKSKNRPGQIIIKTPKKHTIIIEFKTVMLDYLNVAGWSLQERAQTLEGYSNPDAVRNIKIAHHDMIQVGGVFRAGKTISEWSALPKGPEDQLKHYWNGSDVSSMRKAGENVSAYLVYILGNRKVLFSQLSDDGSHFKPFKLGA